MHWLLQKLNSYGNKTAIIADRKISYAELVQLVEKTEPSSPININGGINDITALLAGIRMSTISYFDSSLTKISLTYLEERLQGEPALILASSGTTDKPKQVIHNYNLLVEKYRNRTKPITTVLTYPLNHIAGIDVMFSVLSAGGILVIPKNNSPLTIAKAIEEHQLNYLACTPTFLRLLLVSGVMEQVNLSSLKQISYGAERMSPELLKILIKQLPGVTFRQTYGTTETGVLKIHSDNTTWLKPNNAITLKGEELGLKLPDSFVGYIGEDATIENGYIYLGDTFKLKGDEIQIAGRQALMINVGGQKVNPAEVEGVLYQNKEVRWCKVYGEENVLMGQIVVADVLSDLDVKTIREHCQKHLADYKVPQKINKVKDIPVTNRWKS